jgi:hypothetical protein
MTICLYLVALINVFFSDMIEYGRALMENSHSILGSNSSQWLHPLADDSVSLSNNIDLVLLH